MNSKLIAFFAIFAVLIGTALCREDDSSIQLHFFAGTSIWWFAVDPRNERSETVKVEIREPSESEWTIMQKSQGWDYFQVSSTSGRGFAFPLSIRLTAENGKQVITAVNGLSADSLFDTRTQYGSSGSQPVTQAPVPPTVAPTPRPTSRPTTAPTTRPTPPTQKPTPPTQKPTPPTPKATEAPKPTEKPTQRPTPPTQRPTPPTPKATEAPKPTEKPTQRPTQAPVTPRPTPKATQPPVTPRPTPKATQPPVTPRPTPKATLPPSTDSCAVVSGAAEPMKILVPLYVYPGAAWDNLVTAAKNGAKIIAIINPNSGPAATPSSAYITYMKKLSDAGIEMVGYVHTLWGDRSISTVNNEIGIYASKYPGVTGIFFDEASAKSGDVSYYRQAYNTVMSKSGFKHSILNPGTSVVKEYLDISTNVVIFENYASELSRAKYDSWVKCAPSTSQKSGYKYKFSAIIHSASQSDMSSLIQKTHDLGMGMVYVTDGAGGCCTYNELAKYFTAEASAVKSLNSR